jgi:uncharacterized protein (DUF58 family)
MERWLSKSWVLLGLCGVLLMAALNRHDPMVYGVFLFLSVVTALGFGLPWLSLRSMSVRLGAHNDVELTEAEACDLQMVVQRTAPWPAFMVDIETEWEWANQRTVLRQTVPVIRKGQTPQSAGLATFACRGHYSLVAVRLSSGFPLGLVRAHHSLLRPPVHVTVLPQAQAMHWPLPWDVTDDPLGELTTRRMGQSFELGMLKPYQQGEAVGRVSWRASARAGELVIQHFQHSGSVRLRVVVDVPSEPELGNPDSASEQALRLAVGVCDTALAHGAQLVLNCGADSAPMHDGLAVRRVLSGALPRADGLSQAITRVAHDAAAGEQVAVVVGSASASLPLVRALGALLPTGCKVVVCIAQPRGANEAQRLQARSLRHTLEQAGFVTVLEAP